LGKKKRGKGYLPLKVRRGKKREEEGGGIQKVDSACYLSPKGKRGKKERGEEGLFKRFPLSKKERLNLRYITFKPGEGGKGRKKKKKEK